MKTSWRSASLVVSAVAVLALTTACGQETTPPASSQNVGAAASPGGYGSAGTGVGTGAEAGAGAGAQEGAQAAPAGELSVSTNAELGEVLFWRLAMRPGRPMAVGRIGTASTSGNGRQALLFGLPGNPVAVMVTFLAFVRPALLRMMGCTRAAPPLLRAISTEPMRKKPGRTEYQRGLVTTAADGTLQVSTTGNQGSGVLSSMVQPTGLVVLHHAQGNVAAGEPVDVMMFEGAI